MSNQRFGVILVNLGSPMEPSAAAVRRFLREFLSDQRVVEAPKWLWRALLNLVILPVRSRRVADSYKKIWTPEGSPLRKFTSDLAENLSKKLNSPIALGRDATVDGNRSPAYDVLSAVTYGQPSIETQLDNLSALGVEKILVVPLYPQYSATTTGAVYDRLAQYIVKRRRIPEIICVNNYYRHPFYIRALANSIRKSWGERGKSERLLLSFHGLPAAYAEKGDPYPQQCLETAGMVARDLELPSDAFACSFQSRFGPSAWVKPYTDDLLRDWARAGVGEVDVVCPSFAVDCLETLEEIQLQSENLFREHGGNNLQYVPCLNASPDHVLLMENIIIEYLPI